MVQAIGWVGTVGILFQMLLLSMNSILWAKVVGILAGLAMVGYGFGIDSNQVVVLNLSIIGILVGGMFYEKFKKN